MPNVLTRFFGELEYQTEALFRFPSGLPGFEDHRNFVFLKKPGLEPLMFLQSLDTRSLCFILLPIRAIDQNFQLELTDDEIGNSAVSQTLAGSLHESQYSRLFRS